MSNLNVTSPNTLGMQKVVELVSAGQDTFFYRGKHKRKVAHKVINDHRWNSIEGPLLYAVADVDGLIKYVGKWVSTTPLQSRWVRHGTIHHHERTRNLYIGHLDAGFAPLSIWSVSIAELHPHLPTAIGDLSEKEIAMGLEALFIKTWQGQFDWNKTIPSVPFLFREFADQLKRFPIAH